MAADTAKGNTPIADAFAQGRPVFPDAMALIRKLETDRRRLIVKLTVEYGADVDATLRDYPIDKIEFP